MIDFLSTWRAKVPSDVREEDLWPLFTPFGTVRNLHLLKGSDGKPRGCAMVLFQRWSQAEAAAEALDGQLCLETGGQRKPLVVHFANPRRAPPGQPAEPGIAPRKLFVGQVRPASADPAVWEGLVEDLVRLIRPTRPWNGHHCRHSALAWMRSEDCEHCILYAALFWWRLRIVIVQQSSACHQFV